MLSKTGETGQQMETVGQAMRCRHSLAVASTRCIGWLCMTRVGKAKAQLARLGNDWLRSSLDSNILVLH